MKRVMRLLWVLWVSIALVILGGVVNSGAARAGAVAGAASIVASEGGSALGSGTAATGFTLQLPRDAACSGDSAEGGFRVQSFMVPSSVDVSTLNFGSTGPLPTAVGRAFRQPLYTTTSSPFANAQTANAEAPGGPGPIVNVPMFNLAVFGNGDVPSGDYLIGVACTKGSAAATTVEKTWTVPLSVQVTPAGLAWTTPKTPGANTTAALGRADASPTSASADAASTAVASPAKARAEQISTKPDAAQPTGAPPSLSFPVLDMFSGMRLSFAPWAVAGWLVLGLMLARLTVLLRQPTGRRALMGA